LVWESCFFGMKTVDSLYMIPENVIWREKEEEENADDKEEKEEEDHRHRKEKNVGTRPKPTNQPSMVLQKVMFANFIDKKGGSSCWDGFQHGEKQSLIESLNAFTEDDFLQTITHS